jgi:hypothetical protein
MTGTSAPGEFDKLSLKPGDIVTVRVGKKMDPDDLRPVMNELRRVLPRSVSVLVLPAEIDIKALDAAEMARIGWARTH